MKNDIIRTQDIRALVNTFYDKVRQDDLLKDIFNCKIENRWPEHLEKMYSFWQTVLLNDHNYNGNPFLSHSQLPITKNHFDRWLILFNATVDELFIGEKADLAKFRGQKMAEMFQLKMTYYKNNQAVPIL